MNKLKTSVYPILFLSFILSGCNLKDRLSSYINNPLLPKLGTEKTTITEQETVYIFCEEGDIQDYLDKGWEITDTEVELVPCSWKTEKSRPGCNLKDKGCKISVPDKMGEQIKYLLEKETTLNDSK